jgi:NAD(P)-dependent dehydrogenase (short-subunit alcohol dehydrogenase family)
MAAGQRVLVTGATGAAGPEVLGAFLDAGWRVAAVARGQPPTEPAGVTWVHADLTDSEQTRAAVDAAVNGLGGLDALVCLTGGFSATPIDRLSWADFETQMSRGLRPTVEAVLACRAALEADDGGAIVTIGAQTAQKPGGRVGPYAAAKAAVIAWSASLAVALRPRGVRVNCVLPGTIDTRANRESMPDVKRDTWVQPRALGRVIVFLCSPESAPLTGAAIPIG